MNFQSIIKNILFSVLCMNAAVGLQARDERDVRVVNLGQRDAYRRVEQNTQQVIQQQVRVSNQPPAWYNTPAGRTLLAAAGAGVTLKGLTALGRAQEAGSEGFTKEFFDTQHLATGISTVGESVSATWESTRELTNKLAGMLADHGYSAAAALAIATSLATAYVAWTTHNNRQAAQAQRGGQAQAEQPGVVTRALRNIADKTRLSNVTFNSLKDFVVPACALIPGAMYASGVAQAMATCPAPEAAAAVAADAGFMTKALNAATTFGKTAWHYCGNAAWALSGGALNDSFSYLHDKELYGSFRPVSVTKPVAMAVFGALSLGLASSSIKSAVTNVAEGVNQVRDMIGDLRGNNQIVENNQARPRTWSEVRYAKLDPWVRAGVDTVGALCWPAAALIATNLLCPDVAANAVEVATSAS